jgi:hypothetical protein
MTSADEEGTSSWLDRLTTPLNACSLETYTPIAQQPDGNETIVPLVIGCYQLNEPTTEETSTDADAEVDDCSGDAADENDDNMGESKSTRSGELQLYLVSSTTSNRPSSDGDDVLSNRSHLKFGATACKVEMESGVLDGKWRRRINGKLTPMFASACASGRIHLHALTKASADNSYELFHRASSEPPSDDGSALCLALAWNDYLDVNTEDAPHDTVDQIVSSYSNGSVALHEVSYTQAEHSLNANSDTEKGSTIEETNRWDAHSMFGCPSEVWTCSFVRGDDNVVMSGADDVSFVCAIYCFGKFAYEYDTLCSYYSLTTQS